nr:PREDICTED: oxygen-regulated protein 1-like [Stegastes partitus]
MNETGLRRILPEQYSGSGQTFGTQRHPSIIDPILSKRVCFYKSGDPQFNGLRLVINNRTFKTFDALLDSLSKKVPLPFGVRNITTPRGVHAINTLDELEDGKSYICSDSRKVKPINLALARKKLPPWYHARPVSSRRRTVQQARFFPGRSIHKQEQVLVRTPKRLLVFRNGDPTAKHTVVLNKKTILSYEAILEYISALLQFHVVKLHTPDGRRVDGLPGLILCSGTVVAVGREPFRPAIYSAQKSPAPTWLHTNRMGVRRQKALNRTFIYSSRFSVDETISQVHFEELFKKKSLPYSSKSRNFSPSSERYIVHQIHNTIAESSCEIHSNPTNSVEFESSRILESVAETEGDTCLGDGVDGQTCSLPSEDDIEKSFRVNQDGSMTVEMKVRLTIKEEETIHWTTTLSRSSVASQLNAACLPEPEAEQEMCSLKSTSLDLQSPTSSIDTFNKDRTKDNNDEDPPSPSNGAFSETGTEEDEIKNHTDVASPGRAPTPGHKQISTKQASMESIKSVTPDGIQEGMIGSYSYREKTENRTMTEQYCMIKQSSTRPVPKPRRLGSVDTNSRNVSAFKSTGIMQIESSGEEVTETVLHIYEQQTCQENFLANTSMHMEKKSENESCDISESMSLPAFNSSTSVTNEYVENWLEKAHLNLPLYPNEESTKQEEVTENDRCEESEKKHGLIIAEEKPNMKPVLEKICFSIKSIRQMTQNKRPSCLEKSNSLPDFSSHVASTFGSSSKALLAFLSVMTLKEGITNLNMDELNANNVSCAEALKMIDSLREIASIEDSHKLKTSLSNLQQSASKQLLQSWKGFQELGDKCKSRSSTPESLELITEDGPEQDCGIEESVINEIMESLDIPEKLKEELASLRVGAKSDNDEKISPNANANHFSTEDCANVTQEDNVDVRSIIKRFTDINQTKRSGTDNTHTIAETAKHKPTRPATKDSDGQYGQNGESKNPPAELDSKQNPEERQLHSAELFVQENGLDSCRDAVDQENQEDDEEKTTHRTANLKKEPEEQDVECRQLQTESEESMNIPDNESEHDDKSESEEEGQKSANKDLARKDSCEQTVSSSEAGEQQSSEEEEPEVACEEINQESSEADDLSNPESPSDEEEDKQSSSNYVELNVREKKSCPESENQFLSEEEQSEVECKELSNRDDSSEPARPSSSEKEQQSQTCSMGLNASVEESTGNSEFDESSSEEEQPEVEFKELQVIVEESLSGIEDEEEDVGEEHRHNPPNDGVQTKKFRGLNALIEEAEEDMDSSENEDLHADETQTCDKSTIGRDLIENKDSYTNKDSSSLIMSDSLGKHFRFSADDDSGNDHCDEHVEEEQPMVNDEHISSSMEEELSYYDKESSSEGEQVNMERYVEESRIQYNQAPVVETQPEDTKCEKAAEKLKHHSEEVTSQSVAERVSLLEKQVADAQKRKDTTKSSPIRHFSQRNVPLESDEEDSPSDSPTSQLALCTRSAPQSSLSFSYDSSGVITTEPESNRVRSIREMFLAKSATDVQERRYPSSHELRAETSVSGGYQSQTSSELSSGEDDSARKSITKGFVRRTIERLYGKKDAETNEEASERPPSEQKQKRKEHPSIFSPFHTARAKAMSELSYFNSANALDTLSEATRCITFNAQVGPGDGVRLDDGQWLLRENTLIRKSVSDPVGINKNFTNAPKEEDICKDTEEDTPYSLFSTKPEVEEKNKVLSRKCTYFSLPHASDSDACQDDVSMVSKGSANSSDGVVEPKDNSEDTKSWAERNGMLPGVPDFKIKDNKVHPLTEPPPDGEVVVVQPGKGYGVVNRRLQEPDVLDILYNFCGENCPIL